MPNTYITKVVTDSSPDFGDNPQTITESGQPSTVTIENLVPGTSFWTRAELYENGVLADTSEVETFTTLQAGQLSLSYYQTVRSGYIYDYSWIYSSLYAPSYATCTCNGITVNGFFDYNQHSLNFNVPGLSPNTTYPTVVVLTDIYGFTDTQHHSITTTYVNSINIVDTDAEENFVDVGLQYIVDGGFYNGWTDVWYDYQDPNTDPSLAHYYFSEGDTVIHCDNLTANTGYLFRASITLDDRTTVINSNVVEVTTAAAIIPVNFTDITGVDNTLTLTKNGSAPSIELEYSTDNSTWTTWTESNNVRTLTIPANGTVYIRGNNANGLATNESNYHSFSSTGNVNASGDITTLISKNGTTTLTSSGCFCNLFKAMSTLKTSPTLPATTLSIKCYRGMYEDCSGLVVAPSLPATAVPNEAYFGMFCRCTSLTTPPSTIPATSIGSNACRVMFDGCSSLSSAPTLPALYVGSMGYRTMFRNCTNLRTPADLPATTLGGSCYEEMYRGSGITTPPAVAATSVPSWSFSHTFCWCSSLSEGVDFSKVTAVENNSFYHTYDSCHNLIKAYAPKIAWSTDKTPDWLKSVADSGTLYADESIASSITLNSTSGCPTGWNIKEVYTFLAFRDVSGDANTLTLTKNGTAPTINLEYSTDKTNWTTWEENNNERSLVIPANGTVYLRGNNANGFGYDNNNKHVFSSTGNVEANGDLMRIINKEGSTAIPDNGFRNLFNGMRTLKKAPAISATTYGNYCCTTMYQGCGLTDLSNFKISNPTFPSGSGRQFFGMFLGCRSLTSANVENIFNKETLVSASNAYNQMFAYCSGLTATPEFTITSTLDGEFTGMFQNCSALTDIAKIRFNAITINNGTFTNMFQNCTSLKEGLDIRNATSIGTNAISNMYNGCTSLNVAYAPTVAWNTAKSNNWLNNVAGTGTLYADESIINTITTNSTSGCPNGWNMYKNEFINKYFTVKNEYNGENTIKMGANSTIAQTTIYYSTDNGSTWKSKSITAPNDVNIVTLRSGESVLLKHTGALGGRESDNFYFVALRATQKFSVSGNIASLCFGDNYLNSNLTAPDRAFQDLFYNSTNLISAENLELSGFTTLGNRTYNLMFEDCNNLIQAPIIPDITPTTGTYNDLFDGCRSLNNIKVKLSTWNTSSFSGWVNNVASAGTFTKPSGTTIPTGTNGIPEGWRVVEV